MQARGAAPHAQRMHSGCNRPPAAAHTPRAARRGAAPRSPATRTRAARCCAGGSARPRACAGGRSARAHTRPSGSTPASPCGRRCARRGARRFERRWCSATCDSCHMCCFAGAPPPQAQLQTSELRTQKAHESRRRRGVVHCTRCHTRHPDARQPLQAGGSNTAMMLQHPGSWTAQELLCGSHQLAELCRCLGAAASSHPAIRVLQQCHIRPRGRSRARVRGALRGREQRAVGAERDCDGGPRRRREVAVCGMALPQEVTFRPAAQRRARVGRRGQSAGAAGAHAPAARRGLARAQQQQRVAVVRPAAARTGSQGEGRQARSGSEIPAEQRSLRSHPRTGCRLQPPCAQQRQQQLWLPVCGI